MDLGASTRQKLSLEELNRRTKEGLCRYCGESGHYVKNCPKSTSSLTRRGPPRQPIHGSGYKLGFSQKESKKDSSLPADSKNDKSLF